MGDCGRPGVRTGEVFVDSKFLNPTLYDGIWYGGTIDKGTYTGGATLDEKTASDIAAAIVSYLEQIITIPPEQVAGVFRSCDDNLPLVPNTQLATCKNLVDLKTELEREIGQIGTPGDTVASFDWTTVERNILRLLVNRAGSTVPFDVDFSQFSKTLSVAPRTPQNKSDAVEPIAYFGNNTARLATPDAWRVVPGTNPVEIIPVYYQTNP